MMQVGQGARRAAALCRAAWVVVAAAMAVLLVFPGARACALDAIDASREGSLTLECEYDRAPVGGMSFSLWRVADVDAGGTYTLTSPYAGSGIDVAGIGTASGWDAAAKALYALACSEGTGALFEGTADASGAVSFRPLGTGLYLVSASSVVRDGVCYTASACLIGVPNLSADGASWLYDVKAYPKIGAEPAGPDEPSGPDEPDNPDNPDEPDNPSGPDEPPSPSDPAGPGGSDAPGEPGGAPGGISGGIDFSHGLPGVADSLARALSKTGDSTAGASFAVLVALAAVALAASAVRRRARTAADARADSSDTK